VNRRYIECSFFLRCDPRKILSLSYKGYHYGPWRPRKEIKKALLRKNEGEIIKWRGRGERERERERED
jgi:hypothetical protein